MEGMFISLPSTIDIKLCLMTTGHLCMFDQALYPAEKLTGASLLYLLMTMSVLGETVSSEL